MFKRAQAGLIHIPVVILLLAGVIAGVYLVQQTQIFKPKATGEKLWLIDENSSPLTPSGDVFEVQSQQIRLKIDQPNWESAPQSFLPNLITPALAQQSDANHCAASDGKRYSGGQPAGINCSGWVSTNNSCNSDLENPYYYTSCSGSGGTAPAAGSQGTCASKGGVCATDSGRTSDGKTCSTWLKGEPYSDCNNTYYYCFSSSSCSGGSGAGSSGAGGQTPPADNTTPAISQAVWINNESNIQVTGSNFGTSCSGTQCGLFYSVGGDFTASKLEFSSWSSGRIQAIDRIPGCSSPRSTDCLVKGGYVKVCRSDGKCSGFAQIPDRQIKQEAARPEAAALQGAPAPEPAPIEPEVVEATEKMRISMVRDFVQKDAPCEGSTDPARHCMEFTMEGLVARGFVEWWLPNVGGAQNVWVSFISNKGNVKDTSLKVRIARPQPQTVQQPAAQPQGQRQPTGAARTGGQGTTVTSPARPTTSNTQPAPQNVVHDAELPETPQAPSAGSSNRVPPPEDFESNIPPLLPECPGTCVDGDGLTSKGLVCEGGSLTSGYDCPPLNSFCVIGATACTQVSRNLTQGGPAKVVFDVNGSCSNQFDSCIEAFKANGVDYPTANSRCLSARKGCFAAKDARCDEQYRSCEANVPFGIDCRLEQFTCKYLQINR